MTANNVDILCGVNNNHHRRTKYSTYRIVISKQLISIFISYYLHKRSEEITGTDYLQTTAMKSFLSGPTTLKLKNSMIMLSKIVLIERRSLGGMTCCVIKRYHNGKVYVILTQQHMEKLNR